MDWKALIEALHLGIGGVAPAVFLLWAAAPMGLGEQPGQRRAALCAVAGGALGFLIALATLPGALAGILAGFSGALGGLVLALAGQRLVESQQEWLPTLLRLAWSLAAIGLASLLGAWGILGSTAGRALFAGVVCATGAYFTLGSLAFAPESLPVKPLRALGGAVLLLGLVATRPAPQAMEWEKLTRPALERALKSGQPVLIFASASWSVPSREMEARAFSQGAIIAAAEMFHRFRVDLSAEGEETEAWKTELSIEGPPALLFFASTGEEEGTLRATTYLTPQEILTRLRSIE